MSTLNYTCIEGVPLIWVCLTGFTVFKSQTIYNIEDFHAKRGYMAFWANFHFLSRIKLMFGRVTCFEMKSNYYSVILFKLIRASFQEITYTIVADP